MTKKLKKGKFSGHLGFMLAAASSAVGLGNLWRFPYLAAKDGGGLFLFIYLILVLTFGFTLLVTDISIGRRTGKSSIQAYQAISPKWKFLGILTFWVPALIMTYYAVVGGWVTKYLVVFMQGAVGAAAGDSYFVDFITSTSSAWYGLAFMLATSFIVYNGVEKGIERFAKFIMPILLLMIIGISAFSLTLTYTTPDGITRTGMEGLMVYIIPNFDGITIGQLLQTTLDAMSQMFFSLSVCMGIMITYGSYVKKDVDLNSSIKQIEIVDTLAAFLAGLMIIPAVYVFAGIEGMGGGPSLMFISLPKVFEAMGDAGAVIGVIFFLTTAFAALTSCVSVLEAVTANCMEIFSAGRKKVTTVLTVVYCIASIIIALGYSIFYTEIPMPTGGSGQLLDVMDYISNNLFMPIVCLASAVLIGWVVGPQWIADEMEEGGHKFGRKKMYFVMIRYIAPVLMFILFLQSTGIMRLITG